MEVIIEKRYFRAGDRVMCLDDSEPLAGRIHSWVENGRTYKVANVVIQNGQVGVELNELPGTFKTGRFRLQHRAAESPRIGWVRRFLIWLWR